MSMTEILIQAVANLTLGIGVFTSLACTVGAVMIFDSWLDARKEHEHASR